MAKVLLGWLNAFHTGTITGGPAEALLPVSNLSGFTGSPSSGWQTPAGVTSASVLVDTGDATSVWQVFGLFRTNLTPGTTIRWRVGDPAMTTVTYDSGIRPAGVLVGYGKTVVVSLSPVVGQAVQFDIADVTNPDGFLNVPLAFAGPAFQPQTNIDFSSTVGRDSQIDEVVTRGGQELPVARWQRLRVELSFQGVRTSEVWPQVMEADRVSRQAGNLIFVNDSDNGLMGYETIYGRLTPTADLTYPYGSADRRSWKARLQERL